MHQHIDFVETAGELKSILEQAIRNYSDCAWLLDRNTKEFCLPVLEGIAEQLIIIPEGEKQGFGFCRKDLA
ncbi:MAG: hypothetical protein U5Q03_06365 [Bacteroidota bacterium]|nr:hypothetical protein [Bacteroidota bacterium]